MIEILYNKIGKHFDYNLKTSIIKKINQLKINNAGNVYNHKFLFDLLEFMERTDKNNKKQKRKLLQSFNTQNYPDVDFTFNKNINDSILLVRSYIEDDIYQVTQILKR